MRDVNMKGVKKRCVKMSGKNEARNMRASEDGEDGDGCEESDDDGDERATVPLKHLEHAL